MVAVTAETTSSPRAACAVRVLRIPFLRALERLAFVVPKKSTLPVLYHAVMQVDPNGRIELSATDLDIAIRVDIEGGDVGTVPGVCCIPVVKFTTFMKAAMGDVVTLEANGPRLTVKCGSASSTFFVDKAEEMPKMLFQTDGDSCVVDPGNVYVALNRTLYCVSTDETRYVLNGVLMEVTERNKATFASTDGHRMSVIKSQMMPDIKLIMRGLKAFILPTKGARLLRDTAKDPHVVGDIILGSHGKTPSHLIAKRGNVTMSMRLIDGRFPDYAQVIPTSVASTFTVHRKTLLSALRVVNKDRRVLRCVFKEGSVLLTFHDEDGNSNEQTVEGTLVGEGLDLGINPNYLRQAVDSFVSDEVSIGLGADNLTPIIINAVPNGDWVQAVIMPTRI